jgi:16S rRNA G527 N7-methylase RsmG
LFQELRAIPEERARESLARYLGCLGRWSRKINLTGAETEEAAFKTLVLPVLGAETMLSARVTDLPA